MAQLKLERTAARLAEWATLFVVLGALTVLAQAPPPAPPMPPPGGQQPQPPPQQQAPPQPQPQVQEPPPPAAEEQPPAEAPAPRRRGRRDPFRSLLVRPEDQGGRQGIPPGKRGLTVGQIRLEGIVLTPTDRIAVITVPDRNRAFFLRVKDELFNGYVAEINQDAVVFKERALDAFGRPYEREVVRQVISAAGATR